MPGRGYGAVAVAAATACACLLLLAAPPLHAAPVRPAEEPAAPPPAPEVAAGEAARVEPPLPPKKDAPAAVEPAAPPPQDEQAQAQAQAQAEAQQQAAQVEAQAAEAQAQAQAQAQAEAQAQAQAAEAQKQAAEAEAQAQAEARALAQAKVLSEQVAAAAAAAAQGGEDKDKDGAGDAPIPTTTAHQGDDGEIPEPSLEDLYSDETVDWDDYDDTPEDPHHKKRAKDFNEEYERYLGEMAEEMLTDPELRDQIERDLSEAPATAPEDVDLLLLARRLQETEHRSQLEEQERLAVLRQRRMGQRQREHDLDVNRDAADHDFQDGDEKTWENAEAEDSKAIRNRLAVQRKRVLDKIGQDREKAFRQHMMERELRFREKLKHVTLREDRERMATAHKHTMDRLRKARGHQPGHKLQLEDVWAKEDGFLDEHFDAKVFFRMHDTSQDGQWDIKELESIFYREAVELHTMDGEDGDLPSIDMPAVREEMALMREKVLQEADTDRDELLSEEEFIAFTQRDDFESDDQWSALVPDFSDQELEEFHKKRQRALNDQKKQQHINRQVEAAGRKIEQKFIKDKLKLSMQAIRNLQIQEAASKNRQQKQQQPRPRVS